MGKKPVVILIHGIRDHALWQQEIRDTLEKSGFEVESTNYGRFDLLRFLVPVGYFRKKAIAETLNQIKIVFHNNQGADISVISHSFGTYVFGHILKDNFEFVFSRVILCGSVLKYNFPFEQVQDRFSPKILNEVGTRDIWPAVAESVTFGYGSAGTFGFRRPLVYDRWHNGAHHGYFLDAKFCKKFWLPFLQDGTIVSDSPHPEQPRLFVRLINVFKIKYVLPVAVACLAYAFVAKPFPIPMGCSGLPGETAWIYAGDIDTRNDRFTTEATFALADRDGPPEEVKRGDWIRLTKSRKTMIIDYDTLGVQRALDSPFSSNGKVNYTCKTLSVGDRLYVAYVDVDGPKPAENHMWLRIRDTLPGGT